MKEGIPYKTFSKTIMKNFYISLILAVPSLITLIKCLVVVTLLLAAPCMAAPVVAILIFLTVSSLLLGVLFFVLFTKETNSLLKQYRLLNLWNVSSAYPGKK